MTLLIIRKKCIKRKLHDFQENIWTFFLSFCFFIGMISFSFLNELSNISSQIPIEHEILRKVTLYETGSKINNYRDTFKLIF